MIRKILDEIKTRLKKNSPKLTKDQKFRMYKILNSSNSNFIGYGNKHSEIEKLMREIHNKYQISYRDACVIFKDLVKSNIHDEKISGIFLLNRFKKYFNEETVSLFYDAISTHCDTWAFCDSTCIRVLGPFLGKRINLELAKKTIEKWSNSENLWIRRGSIVILIKMIIMQKDFNDSCVFDLVEKMLNYSEDYIQKSIGWLLKTCSNYKPGVIINYLIKNKIRLPRVILRYATEKLPKEKRSKILAK